MILRPWRIYTDFSKSGVDMTDDDTEVTDSLLQLIIQQFMLHEVEHHSLQAGASSANNPVMPAAHGLIDIYKCLHQGEFGVGHTIGHPEGFKQRLFQEMARGPAHDPIREPAVENISLDGGMLRINLRAVRSLYAENLEGAVEDLGRVCIASAEISQGSSENFFLTLDQFKKLNQEGQIVLAGHVFAFPPAMVEDFLIEVRELMRRIRQVPVFSHSETYRRLNHPSYRVAERSVLKASPLEVLLEKRP
jgi:hypothetical protein